MAELAEQASEAKEEGIAEVLRLLQHPQDLSRLADITAEFESRHRAAKAGLSAMVQTQIESTRLGMELLERSHRHVLKLTAALDRIDRLCAECAELVHHHDKIKLLSTTHTNVNKVLSEIEDIVDLPFRAQRCAELLGADDAHLVPAFEALVLLAGTAEAAKQAWRRGNKSESEVSELQAYLSPVNEVLADAEYLLFDQHLRLPDFIQTAIDKPSLLVDCVRVIELQELVDEQYRKVTMGGAPQRRYRDRFFVNLNKQAEDRFSQLLEQARACNQPNKTIMYDQEGDLVVAEERDYVGALTRVVRLVGGEEVATDDPEELKHIQIITEEVFDEAQYLDELLEGLYGTTDELAAVFDYAAACFPPSYDIFNRVFSVYHVQYAIVVDVLGHGASAGMTTRGALRVMDWVQKYRDTLRNLGVEEELLRLPPSPLADPDSLPGMVVLMNSYVERMETTVTGWYHNILDVDLKGDPKVTPEGQLVTLGVVDFFRILNQQVSIIEALNDHGEVMFQTARTALRVMRGFQSAQRDVLGLPAALAAGGGGGRPGRPLSIEMACAFVNNNVTCYDQSLTFVEDVQSQLDKSYKDQLDVEEVCRGFLDVAKVATYRVAETMYNDPGMSTQLKAMYATGNAEYLAGRTTATLVATLKDYFNDFKVWVTPSFVKRVAEAALEELVRRLASLFATAPPTASDASATAALARRMGDDEGELAAYFGSYLKPDRLRRHVGVLEDMRELMAADGPDTFCLAFSNLAALHPRAFTLDFATRLLGGSRPGLTRKQVADITAGVKDVLKQRQAAAKAAGAGAGEEEAGDSGWGFFGWGKKKQPAVAAAAAPSAGSAAASGSGQPRQQQGAGRRDVLQEAAEAEEEEEENEPEEEEPDQEPEEERPPARGRAQGKGTVREQEKGREKQQEKVQGKEVAKGKADDKGKGKEVGKDKGKGKETPPAKGKETPPAKGKEKPPAKSSGMSFWKGKGKSKPTQEEEQWGDEDEDGDLL